MDNDNLGGGTFRFQRKEIYHKMKRNKDTKK